MKASKYGLLGGVLRSGAIRFSAFGLLTAAVFFATGVCRADRLSYQSLAEDGIVSGFGRKHGDPLKQVDRIQPISRPVYVPARSDLYESDTLVAGTRVQGTWHFAPINTLNTREIINHGGDTALCFCPLAGLVVAVEGQMGVSGLLKYDTFVLYDHETKELILPFDQKTYRQSKRRPLGEVQMLTYDGMLRNFPDAKILDPRKYSLKNPYGSYATDRRKGIGHPKPGLDGKTAVDGTRYHPKERVLIIGFGGAMQKAYPFSELRRMVPAEGGSFRDTVDGQQVVVHYAPGYDWARVTDADGHSLNVGYSYIFALLQHHPSFPLFRADH
ncbi:MAG: DUF3179 domain-containing (seleno)protein [Lentisphaeria bacterium]|nr:DUF3179 domain-containing (seleno)protein [Lentisphaeria bacterium]